jgi:hypothetical protein
LVIAAVIVLVALGLRALRTRRIVKAGSSAQATILYVEKGLTLRRNFFIVRLKLILEITRPDGSVLVVNTARWRSLDRLLLDGWTVEVAYVERTTRSHRSRVAILGEARPPTTHRP